MTFGEKDNKMGAHAVIATLSGLKLGEGFLAQIITQIMELITLVLHHLFSRKNEHKWDDFLIDLQEFVEVMKDKYGSNSQYSHSPLSHYEKIAHHRSYKPQANNTARKNINLNEDESLTL